MDETERILTVIKQRRGEGAAAANHNNSSSHPIPNDVEMAAGGCDTAERPEFMAAEGCDTADDQNSSSLE